MTENRILNYGDRLPESYVNKIQEFIGTFASPNFKLSNPSSTTVKVAGGTDNDQVAIAINGRWRYIVADVTVSHPGGSAGTYNIWVTGSDNSFSGGEPETDSTVYAFGLSITTTATHPATALYRLVGTLTWDGSSITSVTQTVGVPTISTTTTDLTARAGAATQVLIGSVSSAAGIAMGSAGDATIIRDTGPKLTANVAFNATGFQVSGTALAASHLSNGTTGTGAVVLAASPTLSGAPLSATPAADDNTTKIATTAFVLGQAYTSTPAMNGSGAAGSSTRWARGDHVHPSDTSRAPLASPALTGVPTAPTATSGTTTTQIATTAFVMNAVTTGVFTGAVATRFEVSDTIANTPRFQWNVTDGGSNSKLWDMVVDGTTLTGRTRTDGDGAGANWVVITRSGTGITSVNFPTGLQFNGSAVAILASPTFTGTPAAPTAAADTNTTQLATTAFVLGQAYTSTPVVNGTGSAGSSTRWARGDHVHPTDTSRAPLASPSFTGTPTSTTYLIADTGANGPELQIKVTDAAADGKIWQLIGGATTLTGQTITDAGGAGSNWVVVTRSGTNITSVNFPTGLQFNGSTVAVLASPTFTGTPAAPTAAADTNTTQLATTAFVVGQVGTATPLVNGSAAVGTSLRYSRQDHVHPSDTSRAPLASPTFTGTPAAPTASVGTATTQLATTAFVSNALPTSGTLASRPSPSSSLNGIMYFATDQIALYLCASAAWVRISQPAGAVSIQMTATASPGSLLLQGQAWPSTTGIYADLYAKLGSPANVPDFSTAVPVGWKTGDANFATLMALVGERTHALTTAELAVHQHALAAQYAGPTDQSSGGFSLGMGGNIIYFSAAAATLDAGSGSAHNNIQISRVVNFEAKL